MQATFEECISLYGGKSDLQLIEMLERGQKKIASEPGTSAYERGLLQQVNRAKAYLQNSTCPPTLTEEKKKQYQTLP